MALLDRRLAHEVAEEFGAGLDLGRAVQIDATKHITGAGRARFEGKGNRLSGVESLAGNGDLAGERALFHVCYVKGQGAETAGGEASALSACARAAASKLRSKSGRSQVASGM